MELRKRTDKIRKILRTIYPDVKTPLRHRTPFQLLVATILSAQCTDKQVNRVTRMLFQHLKTPADFAAAPLKTIEKHIRSTGFYHNKAKNIKKCSQVLLENHHGKVPRTLEELVKLPGVGRKTANVVLGAAFDTPGMVVDTHVARISHRKGHGMNFRCSSFFSAGKPAPRETPNAMPARLPDYVLIRTNRLLPAD